ncbi:hypothetical protein TSUD_344910 [Trifolium subterraneum]|nr:hypothetical protein TSUD_344910 [Trifolium subterraneum]
MEKKSVGRSMNVDFVPLKRETETLNHARQLVFRNDHNQLAPQPPPSHLVGCCPPPIATGGYIQANSMGDPTMPLRFPRYFSGSSSSTHIPPPPPPPPTQPTQPYLYTSPSRPVSFPTHLIPQHPMNEYHVGHVMSSSHHQQYGGLQHMNYVGGGGGGGGESNYTCIGAPVGQGFVPGSVGTEKGQNHHHHQHQDQDGGSLNWGRSSYSGTHTHNSSINRFQDGF